MKNEIWAVGLLSYQLYLCNFQHFILNSITIEYFFNALSTVREVTELDPYKAENDLIAKILQVNPGKCISAK